VPLCCWDQWRGGEGGGGGGRAEDTAAVPNGPHSVIFPLATTPCAPVPFAITLLCVPSGVSFEVDFYYSHYSTVLMIP
jgi:hypothetical protein